MEKIIQSSPSPRCLPVPTWQITRTSHREGVSVSHGVAGSNPDVLLRFDIGLIRIFLDIGAICYYKQVAFMLRTFSSVVRATGS